MKKLIILLWLLTPAASFADNQCNYVLDSSIQSNKALIPLRTRLADLGYTEVTRESGNYTVLITVTVQPEMEITDPIAMKYFRGAINKEAIIRFDRLKSAGAYNPDQSIDTQGENLFYKEIYRRGSEKAVFKELVEGLRNPPACPEKK